jgi:glycosyltransferase involved in cell wall biosynthesis
MDDRSFGARRLWSIRRPGTKIAPGDLHDIGTSHPSGARDEPVRILRVIEDTLASEGGPIEGIRQMTCVLNAKGHETEIASLDFPDAADAHGNDFKVHALGTRRDFYFEAPKLRHWLIDNVRDYDVVIQHGLWNPSGFATWRAMRQTRRDYVVYTHGMLDPWFRQTYPLKHLAKQMLWPIADGRLLNEAKYVLFTTQEECLAARNAFWPSRYVEKVVRYGTGDIKFDRAEAIAAFSNAMPALAGRPFVLFLSRIHRKKGCDLLIEAFARVADARPDLDLVMAGPDKTSLRPGLEELAKRLRVDHRIHWPGMLEGPAKWGAFFACEAFILPSHQENFGIVIAEAMAAARPVLITNKVNIWRDVEQSGGGLVANDDTDGIASLFEQFLHLEESQKLEMGRRTRAFFLENFEITRAADTLVAVLEDVAGGRR